MSDVEASLFTVATLPLNPSDDVPVIQGGANKRTPMVNVGQVVKKLGSDLTLTTTHAKATNIDQVLPVGEWSYRYQVVYRSDTTGIGCVFGVNFSGGSQTTFLCEGTMYENTTAASAGTHDQVHAAFGLRSGGAQRAPSNTAAGACVGSTSVDTANADMLITITGLIEVTAQGTLELWGSKEASGTGVQTLKGATAFSAWKVG